MCGGILEMIPCSHVGNVFREKTPYTFPQGSLHTISYNTARMAKVWMDDYQILFFQTNEGNLFVDFFRVHRRYNIYGIGARNLTNGYGDISKRLALRERLQCKSFQWYLDNIYPEHELPGNFLYLGTVSTRTFQIYFIKLNP